MSDILAPENARENVENTVTLPFCSTDTTLSGEITKPLTGFVTPPSFTALSSIFFTSALASPLTMYTSLVVDAKPLGTVNIPARVKSRKNKIIHL
jgi:hypothetical protein